MKIPTFERRKQILLMMQEKGFVQAKEVALKYEVSMETIRKDLRFLQANGAVHKEHGGAKLSPIDIEHPLDYRSIHSKEKQQIAHAALSFLDDAHVIFLDAGSTCCELAKCLNELQGLDIITTSLLAFEVLDGTRNNILLTGGRKRDKNSSLTGNWSVRSITSLHADICFLGTSGLYDRSGPTTHSYQELDLKLAMIEHSDATYIVADSHKFKDTGFHTICPWKDINGIITDSYLSIKQYEKYKKLVPIIMAQEEEENEEDC